jgi:hypothetical protein
MHKSLPKSAIRCLREPWPTLVQRTRMHLKYHATVWSAQTEALVDTAAKVAFNESLLYCEKKG